MFSRYFPLIYSSRDQAIVYLLIGLFYTVILTSFFYWNSGDIKNSIAIAIIFSVALVFMTTNTAIGVTFPSRMYEEKFRLFIQDLKDGDLQVPNGPWYVDPTTEIGERLHRCLSIISLDKLRIVPIAYRKQIADLIELYMRVPYDQLDGLDNYLIHLSRNVALTDVMLLNNVIQSKLEEIQNKSTETTV